MVLFLFLAIWTDTSNHKIHFLHLVISWKLKCWDDVIEAGYGFANGTTEMYVVVVMVLVFTVAASSIVYNSVSVDDFMNFLFFYQATQYSVDGNTVAKVV